MWFVVILLLYVFMNIYYRMVGIICIQGQAVVRTLNTCLLFDSFYVCSELKAWEGFAGKLITNTCSS